MSDPFKSKRSILWLSGIAILVLGFLVAAIVLPTTGSAPGEGYPDIRVPKMENVPSADAPRMKLELEGEPEETGK
jgi:hypothetical protein